MKVLKTEKFEKWYKKLDASLQAVIDKRIFRLIIDAHLGEIKRIETIYEMKFRNGLRVYFGKDGDKIVLLLNGGNKNTKRDQNRDIQAAKALWEEYCHDK